MGVTWISGSPTGPEGVRAFNIENRESAESGHLRIGAVASELKSKANSERLSIEPIRSSRPHRLNRKTFNIVQHGIGNHRHSDSPIG